MRLATFSHDGRGFTIPWLPALDSERTLVLVVAGANRRDDAEPLRELRRAYPRSHFLVGVADASGRPSDANQLDDDSIAVAVACFEWTTLRSAKTSLGGLRLRSGEVRAAGSQLAKELVAPGLRGVLLLTDAGASGGRELAAGIASALPPTVAASALVTTNGAPADPAVRVGAAAIAFYGDDLHFQHGSSPLLVTTIGEGGGNGDAPFGDLLAVVANTGEASAPPLQELPLGALPLVVRASATFARSAQVVAPSRAAILG